MSDFDKLKNMNLEEVKNITKISKQRLQDIINKNFKDIDSTRAYGFIKILERDLHLDLREWVQEYNYFLKNGNTDNFTPNLTPEPLESKPAVNVSEPKTASSAYKSEPKKEPKKQNISNIEISTPKAKKSYKANVLLIAGGFIVVIIAFFSYFLNVSSETNSVEIAQENDKQKQEVEENITQSYPKISLGNALNGEDSNSSNSEEKQDSIESKESSGKLNIQAKKQLWFAWVDTTTKKGGNAIVGADKSYELDSNNPLIFHFGNGLLSINVDGKDYDYNEGRVMYLLYTPGSGFKMIDRKEYNNLSSTKSKPQE